MYVCLNVYVCVSPYLAQAEYLNLYDSIRTRVLPYSGLSLFFTSSSRYLSQLFFKIRFLHLKYLSQTSWSCLKAICRYQVSRRFCLDVQINRLVKRGEE